MSWRSTGIALATFRPGDKREVLVEGSSILLVRLGERVYATEGVCPHLGGLLADGSLEGENLVCREHGATFDIPTGAVRADPDGVVPPQGAVTPLRRYEVRVQQGIVEVDVPPPGPPTTR